MKGPNKQYMVEYLNLAELKNPIEKSENIRQGRFNNKTEIMEVL